MARYAELRNFKSYMGTNKTSSHVANFKREGFNMGKVKASEYAWKEWRTKLVFQENLSGLCRTDSTQSPYASRGLLWALSS